MHTRASRWLLLAMAALLLVLESDSHPWSSFGFPLLDLIRTPLSLWWLDQPAKLCLARVWSQGTITELLGAGCFSFLFCLFVTVS